MGAKGVSRDLHTWWPGSAGQADVQSPASAQTSGPAEQEPCHHPETRKPLGAAGGPGPATAGEDSALQDSDGLLVTNFSLCCSLTESSAVSKTWQDHENARTQSLAHRSRSGAVQSVRVQGRP